ncbi:MAG TPA: NTP transferase domain-containing protein [Spirochaetota bacterium]|nr:NTP transferase domain-containing protein [Spirochaetota bacterium]HOM38264.1 NTP transferase domain-containing protein [Spirochaetota bacterium]HPQ48518.1 NTP transferase domain-containing protein [Spirochaetota bacterium]
MIILASGLGTRLKKLTEDKPKAMVQVAGKPLIQYCIDFVDLESVKKIKIIGGYKIEVLREYIEKLKNPKIEVIENNDYKRGSTITLSKGISDNDFLLMNADHIYPPKMFSIMKQNFSDDKILIATDKDRKLGPDDMKVALNEDGSLKAISKTLDNFSLGYIGMSYIGKNLLNDYKKELYKVIEETEGKANVEAVLDSLCKRIKIYPVDLSNIGWYEVDTPEERDTADKVIRNKGL